MEHDSRAGRVFNRRRWLATCAAALTATALPAAARPQSARSLAFRHLHTGETLDIRYFRDGRYDAAALRAINHLLRDFRTGEVYPVQPTLLDQLNYLHRRIGSDAPFEIISAFRSPATNSMLHKTSPGVASGSLHMQGMAIDVRLADTRISRLRDVALDAGLGGVGYYASSNFVHLDIGRPRHW